MEAEQLKVIAEGMGYEIRSSKTSMSEDRLMVWNGFDISTRQKYNPLTNNDQMVEIINELKIDTEYWYRLDEWSAEPRGGASRRGKTINEAVCNAAYEYFKED